MTGPTEVPRWLQGAWRREGLARRDGPMEERSDVLWLQTASYFADVRVPNLPVVGELDGLDERQAFSGVGSFVDPRFTWDHDIDTRQRQLLSSDTALLERRSTFLLERGEDYVERWRREAEPDRVAVLEWSGEACAPTEGPAPLARIVVVGRLAVGVWRHPSPAATSLVRASTGWSTTATFGRLGPERELVEVMLDRMDRGHDLVRGWIRK
jgi:hypothetical protein